MTQRIFSLRSFSPVRDILIAGAMVATLTSGAIAQSLKVGDKAPALDIGSWVKGEPVTSFDSDKFYVVEFWATWCGPCITGMPHLSELQEQYENDGLVVIGVNIWDDAKKVQPFLDKGNRATRGKAGSDLMHYRVATDKVDNPKKIKQGVMARTWMAAAGRNSIPSAFVVDYDQNIAWIGHPARINAAVQKLASEHKAHASAGSSSMSLEQQIALEEKAAPIIAKVHQAMEAKQHTRALSGISEILRIDKDYFGTWAATKVAVLAQNAPGSRDTLIYARQLVTTTYKDNAGVLSGVAESLLNHEPTNPNARKIADGAIAQATTLARGTEPRVFAATAMAKHVDGDNAGATVSMTKALEMLQEHAPESGASQYTTKAHDVLTAAWTKRLHAYSNQPYEPDSAHMSDDR